MKHTKLTKKQAFKMWNDACAGNIDYLPYVCLNDKGRAKLRAFIRKHWKNDIVRSRSFDFNGFYSSINFDGYFSGYDIHFEIGQFNSKSHNPECLYFDSGKHFEFWVYE